MKIDFKRAMLWLAGTAAVCLGISFFLFRQAGVVPSDLGRFDSSSENGYSRKVNDSVSLGNVAYETIEIKTVSVPVKVVAAAGGLKAELTGNFRASDEESMPYLDVSATDDGLFIEVKHPKGLFAGAVSADSLLSVYIPENSLDELRVKSVSGNINVGSFEIKRANLGSVSGAINAERLSLSEGIFESTSGNIKIGSLSGRILSKTTSGKMDIGFEEIESPAYMESISGNVDISIPENAAFTLKTETVSGNLVCEAPLTIKGGKDDNLLADIGGGGPILEIRTVSGGMNLH